jgi:S-adenosylmethionine/arginine decarboxylase-like enzyme
MRRKTRRIAKTKTKTKEKIQHHHLLLRCELGSCPSRDEKDKAILLIQEIIRDIGMELLATPHVYYVSNPKYNEGLTAIAPIQTSHIAFHFWSRPDTKILHNSQAKALLQFDVYTCGTLSVDQVRRIMHHLTQYVPYHVDITLLNRNSTLKVERHMKWDLAEGEGWQEFLESDRFA